MAISLQDWKRRHQWENYGRQQPPADLLLDRAGGRESQAEKAVVEQCLLAPDYHFLLPNLEPYSIEAVETSTVAVNFLERLLACLCSSFSPSVFFLGWRRIRHPDRIFQFFYDGVNELRVPYADIVARNVNEDVNFFVKGQIDCSSFFRCLLFCRRRIRHFNQIF